jgi:hypothetical protein
MIELKRGSMKKIHRANYCQQNGLIEVLLRIPIKFRGSPMVEIGSFYGESACIWSLFFSPVYCVDVFFPNEDVHQTGDGVYQTFKENTVGRDIVVIRKLSMDAVNDVPEDLSMVYVDADHKYSAVKEDVLAYWPKIKMGGFMCGHDYGLKDARGDGVKPAVDEIFGTPDFVFEDTSWLVKKVPGRL